MTRTSTELQQQIDQTKAEWDQAISARARLIGLLEAGLAEPGDKRAAADLTIEIDILDRRLARLQDEHFAAVRVETIAEYRAGHEEYRRLHVESAEMRRGFDEFAKRQAEEKKAHFIATQEAENRSRAAMDDLRTFIPEQMAATYGERLLHAISEQLDQIDAEFGMANAKHMGH